MTVSRLNYVVTQPGVGQVRAKLHPRRRHTLAGGTAAADANVPCNARRERGRIGRIDPFDARGPSCSVTKREMRKTVDSAGPRRKMVGYANGGLPVRAGIVHRSFQAAMYASLFHPQIVHPFIHVHGPSRFVGNRFVFHNRQNSLVRGAPPPRGIPSPSKRVQLPLRGASALPWGGFQPPRPIDHVDVPPRYDWGEPLMSDTGCGLLIGSIPIPTRVGDGFERDGASDQTRGEPRWGLEVQGMQRV